ncbi:DUF6134 family protein [Thalassospira sp. TSL5-1]|uniref:DUF6134 family protein n=1 Tax=Thalassospira sp. TSL5-1 TaxID=1544451 RepID=UPI00208EA133|nr:DUF6134 family protein [Thalassospira sp. TSL5-1]
MTGYGFGHRHSSLPLRNTPIKAGFAHLMPVSALMALLLAVCLTDIAHAASPSSKDKDTAAAILPDANCSNPDPIKLYGGADWTFQIRREGSPVGTHHVSFHQGRDGLQVISESDIRVSFLGFSAYQFVYRSEALWQKDELTKLAVTVDDDGDKTAISAQKDTTTGKLVVKGPNGTHPLPEDIFPTNHWHCGILSHSTVLNTLTGNENDVKITNLGTEKIVAGNGGAATITATHIRYEGELNTDAWYDARGRWVGLSFKARDGSKIIYRCLTCTKTDRSPQ